MSQPTPETPPPAGSAGAGGSDDATSHHVHVIRDSLFRHADDGPLPALLLALTVVTGMVDAVSILGFGRVFVANMTGNIVFLALALAHAPGFSLINSAFAVAGFVVGARAGGAIGRRWSSDRGVHLRAGCLCQLVLIATALPFVIHDGPASGRWSAVAATSLCACAMGIQNSTVRALAVPDLTTTVLTMTITGIAVDRWTHRPDATIRRVLSVLLMGAGALFGALLVLNVDLVAPLSIVVAMLGGVVVACVLASRGKPDWLTPTHAS